MRWAPPSENGYEITKGYFKFVAKGCEKEVDDSVEWENKDLVCKIVYLMTVFENGSVRAVLEESTPNGPKGMWYPEALYPIIEQAYDAVERGG